VAVVAKRFGVLSLAGWKRGLAKTGLWVSITGVMMFTAVFVLEAFTTVFPGGVPGALFASNPGGSIQLFASTGTAANGMAGDDTTMLWAALGAIIVLVPLLFTTVRGRPAWRDPVRGSILLTWIFSFIATPLQGFYIEFHESTYSPGGVGGPTDVVFGNLQYFALISITLVCMSLLAVDYYVDKRGLRTPVAGYAMLSVLIATVGGYVYVWYGTSTGSPGYWVFNVGLILMDLFLVVAMVAVYLGRQLKSSDSEAKDAVPEVAPAPSPPEPGKAPG